MSKNKNNDNGQDVSVFPDGYVLHAWGNEEDGGRAGISSSRTRMDQKRINVPKHKGKLYFPVDRIPEGWQYAWMTERLLNEEQPDNIQNRYDDGWIFVKQSEHPEFQIKEMTEYFNRHRQDGLIRKGGQILMKKPKHEYEAEQEAYRYEGDEIRQKSVYLTDYFGSNPSNPKFVVENTGSYTPNYTHKGN